LTVNATQSVALKMDFKQLFITLLLFSLAHAKVVVILYEELEICVPPEERAHRFDLSGLELIAESDTQVYLNGSWKFVRDVNGPWESHFYGERYDRNEWSLYVINRHIPDICAVMQNPTEIWYQITKTFEPKTCPYPAGVS